MILENNQFECRNETCGHDTTEIDRETLLDRLSGDSHFQKGYPSVLWGDCPICNADSSVDGGPDGELVCGECDFYAGQYSAAWFCYAIWMREPDKIRVNV